MADVVVNEKVVNKAKEVGVIESFDEQYIIVQFSNRVVKFARDAFEKGFLRYENPALQNVFDEAKREEARQAEEKRVAAENAAAIRRTLQADLSRRHRRVALLSAAVRLEPAPLSLSTVRKKDQALVQEIFAACDRDIETLYASFQPDMHYPYYTSHGKTKYCVGFLTNYLDTYVFRVFSRNDTYKKAYNNDVTIKHSDTTEVMRVMAVNGKLYYFTKHVALSGGSFSNSASFKQWHVSDFNSAAILNDVIQNCDCGYLNGYIAEHNVDCAPYIKLLFLAFCNSKAEIVFKNKRFLSTYRIENIAAYLDGFSSKQIDYAANMAVINALPVIKEFGLYDVVVLMGMEKLMKKRRHGESLYNMIEQTLTRLGMECADLCKRLVRFIQKVDRFDEALYWDYVTELAERPGVTIKDFFDKDYMYRHEIMMREKQVRHSREEDEEYGRVARELSWIDREENDYVITVPKTIPEFMYEGDIQHNCVYTCRYYREVIARRSIVVFLRKEINVPYVTIEFDYETFEVLQAYGKRNSDLEDELYAYIVDLGKRLKREMLSRQ